MKQKTGLSVVKSRISKHYEIPYSLNRLHGSNECSFENIAVSIGINHETMMDDDVIAFYESYLELFNETEGIMNNDFVRSLVLNCMLYMGKKINRCDKVIVNAFQERLDRVFHFAISGERIFYTEEERKQIKSVPSVWKNERIVRYEHTSPYLCLPNVYDLLGFSVMYGRNNDINHKINKVIDYIFSINYQEEVQFGYGIGINGEKGFVKSSFYAVGWDLCLSHLTPRQEVLYMILLSPISCVKDTNWYQSNIDKYRKVLETDDNQFISQLYTSIRKTYWTSGCYINFERNKEDNPFLNFIMDTKEIKS